MPSTMILLLVGAAVGGLLYLIATAFLRPSESDALPLPPGPKPLPVLGNIRDLPGPEDRQWEHWLKHRELYGPISSLTVLGQPLIIINDGAIALELMEKRGQYHSSRPRMVFAGEMCGWGNLLVSQTTPEDIRNYRRPIAQIMGSKTALSKFADLQEVETHRFLLRTLKEPERLAQNIKTLAGAIILKLAYGYNVEPHKEDPLVHIAELALEQFSRAAEPGAWMVDTIPALRYLPDWFPGTGFKKTAREWNATLTELTQRPIEFVKQEMAEKRHTPSYVSKLYDNLKGSDNGREEDIINKTAASLYTGGADTSVNTLINFFLCMLLNPEVQAKAREEIDRVVGTHRLPTFADRPNLPYIDAIVKEALRWQPVAPTGIPHFSSQQDVCQGYLIPQGAILIPNIWFMTHDPKVYDDPMAFNPDRFLADPPARNPADYVFGFGRRICPGLHLADASIWLTVVRSLAVFEISKPIEDGKIVEPKVEFSGGIISHPAAFKAAIRPRSEKYEELIRSVEVEHPFEESDAAKLRSVRV